MLWLQLDGDGPLHRQLHRALKAAILEGRLEAGRRLPSTRNLARELGLSRNTVLQAVEQLVAEGYASGRVGSGTYVSRELAAAGSVGAHSTTGGGAATAGRLAAHPGHGAARPGPDGEPADEPALSQMGRRIAALAPPGGLTWSPWPEVLPYDFRYGEPCYADLPLDTWTRLLGRRARRMSARRLGYQSPGGAAELREALVGYLARARGVSASPDQVIVVQGSQQGIDLTARLLVDPGDRVVVEEPHYTGFSLCLGAAGAELVPVPVDGQGLRVDELRDLDDARMACVTPSHQYPTGSVLSLPRRLALLEWAARTGAVVVEDDYDGEFRFDGAPIESLQSLDRRGSVVYLGTASKLLFPSLRLGWIVAPPALAPHFVHARALADTGTPSLEQLVLADFISEGHLERHARRARLRMAAKRRSLLEAVDEHLGSRAEVSGAQAGLHVMLRLPGIAAGDVRRLRRACRDAGVGVYPASVYYRTPPPHAELLLGYGAMSEEAIREGIRRLAGALAGLGRD